MMNKYGEIVPWCDCGTDTCHDESCKDMKKMKARRISTDEWRRMFPVLSPTKTNFLKRLKEFCVANTSDVCASFLSCCAELCLLGETNLFFEESGELELLKKAIEKDGMTNRQSFFENICSEYTHVVQQKNI